MPPNVHTFTHHPALVRDIGCYGWGAMLLKLGGSRSLLSAVGDRLSLCLITGTLPKFVSVDEQSNHESRHVLRLGEAQRAADEALDPGPQIAVCALDFPGVLLAYLMLLNIEMPLVGSPA